MTTKQKTQSSKIKPLLNAIILAEHREFEARCRMMGAVDIAITVLKNHREGGCGPDNDDAIKLLMENLSREERAWNHIANDLYETVEKMSEEVFGRGHFIATAKQIDKEVA